ncbi:MAG TPA: DUF5666 domain-containing protein [Candidatus Methylomirabilis sp.]|nr:DUF5666 domain-containing protein [Candidatus Methylomirabilis sp.]
MRCAIVALVTGLMGLCGAGSRAAAATGGQTAQGATVRPVGTVKAFSGKTITLASDSGAEVTVQLQDDTRLLRVAPGEKDLKNAAPLNLQDLQVGDRILVRGAYGPDGKTVLAASVIAMKQADIATKQAHEREEWQRHGVGGLVTKIDSANGTITIATNATGAAKDVAVHVSKQTMLRRYAPDSVMFDEAKVAPIEEIKEGDQLRARGTRSADGMELTADEVVSGTFRNIAGTIDAIDGGAGTITVTDLVIKKPVTIRISKDTQLRRLAPPMAQMIAARLKGEAPENGEGGNGAAGAAGRPAEGAGGGRSGAGQGRPGAARGGDFQQALARMPAVTLADLQKGDAVMIVTTEGTPQHGATAITLLAGVEPILEASPKGGASSILTPWTMSGAPSGDTTP